MKNFLIGLVVFVLLVFGIVYILNFTTTDSDDANPPTFDIFQDGTPSNGISDEQDPDEELPENYRLLAEPDFNYTIAVPEQVDVSSPQEGITRYRFVGPESEAGTEITDGYTITIEATNTQATSLQAFATQVVEDEPATVIEEPTTERLGDTSTMRYVSESELNNQPITHYLFLPDNGFGYIASVNVSPDNNREYRSITTDILETLRFLDNDTAQSYSDRVVPIAMLDYEASGNSYTRESDGIERGCDQVVIINHVLDNPTNAPLTASLEQLFAYESDTVGGWQNFMASQNDTLSFERVDAIGNTARIYLTGELGSLGGVCDNPRAAIQIEETALAHDDIDNVELYLNGEPTDLMPSGR